MILLALMIGCAAFIAAIVAPMIRARRDSDDLEGMDEQHRITGEE